MMMMMMMMMMMIRKGKRLRVFKDQTLIKKFESKEEGVTMETKNLNLLNDTLLIKIFI
jgi:hypothetical protein